MNRDPNQIGIFDTPTGGAPYQAHSETSKAAAKEITPHINRCHRLILDYLKRVGIAGATDQELEDATGMGGSTVRPRRIELVKKELVEDSGRTRETRAGRKATVWVAV